MRRTPTQLGGILVVTAALLCAVTVGTVTAASDNPCLSSCIAQGGTVTGDACVLLTDPVQEDTPGVGPGGNFTRTETCVTVTTFFGQLPTCQATQNITCTVTACTNPGGNPANPKHCT
jgi:hypothetical protein